MSKAEERSREIMQAALDYAINLDDIKPTDELRRNLCILLGQAFIKGAEWANEHQAEKDLKLTWEDIQLIYNITYEESRNVALNKGGEISEQEFYQEVLKRFKEMKEKT